MSKRKKKDSCGSVNTTQREGEEGEEGDQEFRAILAK